ncbi:helix-turn-helix domain-containing protein [Sedimentibacter saalensis]|uniref:helix-turn-helix domain-containing protein n=1 Tax=Sedimentibacter saalensis TaxID=130788 RepID=UPI00289BADFC|nr:helix-turn-helix transcriptional regulator [Sedimentibacter saalensis]
MAVCYNRLFKLLIDKKMTNVELAERAGFSANIITRLKRNNYNFRIYFRGQGKRE